MARYLGPKDKKSRAAHTKLLLRGEHDLSAKSGFARRPYPPGQHGQKRAKQKSEYGQQLLEKQKLRWVYGMLERQFRRYVEDAKSHKGVTSELLIASLESRLDNVVFRMGLSASRNGARQVVNHGHITVNGKRVTIPSFAVKKGDVVGIRTLSRPKKLFADLAATLKKHMPPSWLELDKDKAEGTVIGVPSLIEASVPADVQKIVEFYSR